MTPNHLSMLAKIIRIIREELYIDEDQVINTDDGLDMLGADSLAKLTIGLEVSEAFDFEFVGSMPMKHLASPQSILEWVIWSTE